MFNNYNSQNANLNQPMTEINTLSQGQQQEVELEKDEEILEKAKNYIIEIRKRDNDKIKIEKETIVDPQTDDMKSTKYINPTKDMFDSSFYAFLTLIKKINGFISHYIISKKIDDLIEILREDYLKLKKQYSSNKDAHKQKQILLNAETLYMITLYIYMKLINKKDKDRYILPSRLIDYLHRTKDFYTIYSPSEGYFIVGTDFTSKYKVKDWKKLEDIMTKITTYVIKADHTAYGNYFKAE